MVAGGWRSADLLMRYAGGQFAKRGRPLPARAGVMTAASRRSDDELTARSAAGEWFVINHPIGGLRPAAHVFACVEGIAFAHGGWQDPACVGQHTMHAIEGELRTRRRPIHDR